MIDEINTPDSSRYWLKDSYEARHAAGQEPDMIDKEFLRLWFAERYVYFYLFRMGNVIDGVFCLLFTGCLARTAPTPR